MVSKDWFYQQILPTLAWIAINSLTITLRIIHKGEKTVEELRKRKKKIVYTFWHGRQFLLVRYLSNKNISIMSSTSRDGILQANILKKFGYDIIYGSSSKSPVRALVGSINKMKSGLDVAFAVDGPTGPLHKVKPGALFIAKKMDALIVPMTFSAQPAITLSSWDKYLLPKPFAQSAVVFGEPFHLSPDLGGETLHEECLLIETVLNQITKEADSLVQLNHPK